VTLLSPYLPDKVPLVFLDESGDHGLTNVDPASPVFVLCGICTSLGEYRDMIVPAWNELKIRTFGHEGPIIHSTDIRKRQGAFVRLNDPLLRKEWMTQLTRLLATLPYTLVAVAIHKTEHASKYREPAHPYHYALEVLLERVAIWLDITGQTEARLIAEARGKAENRQLLAEFGKLLSSGTDYRELRRFELNLEFVSKSSNVIGCQIADLAAYPVARHVFDPDAHNAAFETLAERWLFNPKGRNIGFKRLP
jgi:hypothetical protein